MAGLAGSLSRSLSAAAAAATIDPAPLRMPALPVPLLLVPGEPEDESTASFKLPRGWRLFLSTIPVYTSP